MSLGISYLHSHSAIERELKFPKHIVLVDKEYANLFLNDNTSDFRYQGKNFIKVNILSFVFAGGVFKNLSS